MICSLLVHLFLASQNFLGVWMLVIQQLARQLVDHAHSVGIRLQFVVKRLESRFQYFNLLDIRRGNYRVEKLLLENRKTKNDA